MSEGKYWPIPSDWNGEDWACINLQWPNSPQFLGLLTGLLYTLTRGREYNGATGIIKDAQLVGWQIFDKNTPFIYCPGTDGGDGAQDGDGVPVCGGGATIYEESDAMGQTVTDVRIDEESGELVVEFGPCCVFRYPLTGLTGGDFPQPDEDDWPDLPETDPPQEFTACAKVSALWDVWVGVIDLILDRVAGGSTPWSVVNALKAEYPSVNFGLTNVLNAYTAAVGIVIEGLVEEVEGVDAMQEVLCQWERIPADDDAGLSSDQYDAAKNVVSSVADKYFTVFLYPLGFGWMQELWFYALSAIGKSDVKDITTGVEDTSQDCTCPGVGEAATTLMWNGEWSETGSNGVLSATVENGGLTLRVKLVANGDEFSAIRDFRPYLLPIGGAEVTSLKVGFEMLSGNLFEGWFEDACATREDTMKWEVGGFTSHEIVSYPGGNGYNDQEFPMKDEKFQLVENEGRCCPRNTDPDDVFEFLVHIVEVNGVATGRDIS